MQKIYKYPLPICDLHTIALPVGAKILSVGVQAETPCIWALVDVSAKVEPRHFRLYGTGHPFGEQKQTFIGTVLMAGGALVFHLFETVV